VSVASDVRDRRPALQVANVGFDDLLGGFHFSALSRKIARKKNNRAKIMAAKNKSTGAHNNGRTVSALTPYFFAHNRLPTFGFPILGRDPLFYASACCRPESLLFCHHPGLSNKRRGTRSHLSLKDAFHFWPRRTLRRRYPSHTCTRRFSWCRRLCIRQSDKSLNPN
jgi:hypothetical protein